MKTIKGQTFDGVEVTMDGTIFVGCKITNCELIYSGGVGGWNDTDVVNCRITLRGAAASTAGFLEKFGLIDPKGPWHVVKVEYPPEETVQ